MKLQILHVADCPNVAPLTARLSEVLAGHDDVEITDHELGTLDEAAAFGMAGSPTLLVDGVDLFATPGQQPSLSCRLGVPSLAELEEALGFGVTDPPAFRRS